MTPTLPRATPAARPLQGLLAAHEAFERMTSPDAPPWLRALRTSGISYFAELGFPTLDHEEWRFTNVAPIAQGDFHPILAPAHRTVSPQFVDSFRFDDRPAHRLVFVDGVFAPELSGGSSLPAGAKIGSLAEAIAQHGSLLDPFLGRLAPHQTNAFTALNTAFVRDGAFVFVPADGALLEPVHLLFVATQRGALIQPRNLIVVHARGQARVIEDYVSLGGEAAFTNTVTELFTAEGAAVEHVKIQREHLTAFHVATIEAHQRRQSHVVSHSISLGARLARNDIHLRFEGEGGDSILNGLYLARGDQLVDHHTVADHRQPHCASHEFYHGILDGHARGVFNGKIFVRPGAQKTDAKQTNKNLLLSRGATISTKPQLEIFADDVKCTHGATVGQLDEQALFYLRARGLGESRARQMLIKAFAAEVLNRISLDSVRNELERLLDDWLAR